MNFEIRKVEKEELLGDLFDEYNAFEDKRYLDMNPEHVSDDKQITRTLLEENDFDRCWPFAFLDSQMVGNVLVNRPNQTIQDMS